MLHCLPRSVEESFAHLLSLLNPGLFLTEYSYLSHLQLIRLHMPILCRKLSAPMFDTQHTFSKKTINLSMSGLVWCFKGTCKQWWICIRKAYRSGLFCQQPSVTVASSWHISARECRCMETWLKCCSQILYSWVLSLSESQAVKCQYTLEFDISWSNVKT